MCIYKAKGEKWISQIVTVHVLLYTLSVDIFF